MKIFKRPHNLLILLLFLSIIAPSSAIATVLDQAFIFTGGGASLGANVNEGFEFVAQTFTAGVSGSLTAFSVNIQSSPGKSPLQVAVYSASQQLPIGTALTSQRLTTSQSLIPQVITLTVPVDIIKGQEYAIVVNYPDVQPGAGQGQGVWIGEPADKYAGGQFSFSQDGINWRPGSTVPNADLYFRTFVDTTEENYRFVFLADSRSETAECDLQAPKTCTNVAGLSRVLRSINSLFPPPDFLVFGGDMVNGKGTGPFVGEQLGEWKSLVDMNLGSTFSDTKLLPVFGGHEQNLRGRCESDPQELCNQDSGNRGCRKPNDTCVTYLGVCSNNKGRFCNRNSDCNQQGICEKFPRVWSAFDSQFNPVGQITVSGLSCYYFDKSEIRDSTQKQLCTDAGADYGHTAYFCDFKNARLFILNNDWDPYRNSDNSVGNEIGPCQREWVKSKLTGAGAKTLNFLFQHEPNYGTIDDDLKPGSRDLHVEMLGCSGATVVSFAGHEHQYTRGLVTGGFFQTKAGRGPICGDSFVAFSEAKAASAGAPWYNWRTQTPGHLEKYLIEFNGFAGRWVKKTDDEPNHNEPYHYVIVDVVGEEVSLQAIAVSRFGDPVFGFADVSIDPKLVVETGLGLTGSIAQVLDSDVDGALDTEEGTGDTDGDGILDFQDRDTARVASARSGTEIAFDAQEDKVLLNTRAILDTDPSVSQSGKPDQDFVLGLVGAEIVSVNPSQNEAVVALEFPSDLPTNSRYFAVGSWQELPITRTDSDSRIEVRLIDGGLGDMDGKADGVISHLGGLGTARRSRSNDLLSFEPIIDSFRTTGRVDECVRVASDLIADDDGFPDNDLLTPPFVDTFEFRARLANVSENSIADLTIEVVVLSNEAVLANADEVPTEKPRITVGRQDGYQDGRLNPGETVDVPFSVCLTEIAPFRLFVDVIGRRLD